jgi:hypothetical protein
MLKRQEQSSKITNEQIQRKLAENGIHKDDLSKDLLVYLFLEVFFYNRKILFQLLCPRKRTSFSPVITRKRGKRKNFLFFMIINENYLLGKAIKKRTPSASQVASIITIDDIESVGGS